MPIKYISTKSTYLYEGPRKASRQFTLIYGDEVDATHQRDNNRHKVKYRGRWGWVQSDRLMPDHPLEMYFIDVGQGDSVFIVTPQGRKILVDGGISNEAFQFIVWKYRLDGTNPAPLTIDLMVVSHADDDHMAGLISIITHPLIHVKEIIHSGIAKYNSGFDTELGNTVVQGGNRFLMTRHDSITDLNSKDLGNKMTNWRDAVNSELGLVYRAVDSTTGVLSAGDPSVALHVLGPRLVSLPGHTNPAYPWFMSSANTINGHSVVLRLDFKNVRVLLPGDLNKIGARYLMEDPNFLREARAHVLKAPHHGSHEYERRFLKAVNPQITVVSSGESPDHGHPRANFLGTIGNVSRLKEPLLFSTELVAQFAVDSDAEALDADDEVNPTDPAMIGQARRRFKKRLNGIINIRTDGDNIYCARRVAAVYQFVTYKQRVAPRD